MFQISSRSRLFLLVFAIIALVGPNGMYLYYTFTRPDMLQAANTNPIALAFMVEAFMLLGLFLFYVWNKTKSALQVTLYLVLTFIGSLAFSSVIFFYVNSKPESVEV